MLKWEIIRLSDERFTLLRMSELKQQLAMRLPDEPFTYRGTQGGRGAVGRAGHVWQLEFGQFARNLQQTARVHESAMLAGPLICGNVQRHREVSL